MHFVFDLDGTICFKGQPVTEPILNSLEQLTESGHQVIFASARPIRDLLPILHKRFHGYTMIGGNGSLLMQKGNITKLAQFKVSTLKRIKTLLLRYDATYLMDSDWDYAYNGPANHPILKNLDSQKLAEKKSLTTLNTIIKILVLTSLDMESLYDDLQKLDVIIHLHGDEGILDISPYGINKWSAIQRLGIPACEYIAFGNDANDIAMFEHAHHAIMIGHNPTLFPYADENISYDAYVEENIIAKLAELDNKFAY